MNVDRVRLLGVGPSVGGVRSGCGLVLGGARIAGVLFADRLSMIT
jgi:hypothetical protein